MASQRSPQLRCVCGGPFNNVSGVAGVWEREHGMSRSRTKALVFGLLAFVLVGPTLAASASASPGPFWYHRAIGAKESGVKVAANAPEGFSGEGGAQTLENTILGTAIEITSSRVQVKGAISNNAFQGQVKLELIYNQPTLVKPAASGCSVTVGAKNIIQVKGHLMWKYVTGGNELNEQGAAGQKVEMVFTPKEIQQGATGIPGGVFTTITLAGSSCLLAGTNNIEGSQIGYPSPSGLEEFSTKLAVRTTAGAERLVHFWNGEKNVEGKVGLKFANNESNLIGQTETKANQQEIAVKAS
jgi:hypothetical protein